MGGDLGWGRKRLIQHIVKSQWGIDKPDSMRFSYNELLFIIQELLSEEGKPYHEGDGGIGRGYHVFRTFVQHLLYRNLANYDSMVLITSDKGCFFEDALIEMPRDLVKYPKGIPIKDLIGKKDFYVYSFNIDTKKLEVKKAGGCCYVKTDDVYEIELTNGWKTE